MSTLVASESILQAWEIQKSFMAEREDEIRAIEHRMEPKVLVFAREAFAVSKLRERDRETLDRLILSTQRGADLNGLEVNTIITKGK